MGKINKEVLDDFRHIQEDVNEVLNEELEIVSSEPMNEEAVEMISENFDSVHKDFERLFDLISDPEVKFTKEAEFRELLGKWQRRHDKMTAMQAINGVLELFNDTCEELLKSLKRRG